MKNLPILYKLVLLVVIMAAVTGIISAVAYISIERLSVATDEIDAAGKRAVLGARIRQGAVAMNRAEYRVSADPTPQTLAAVMEILAEQEKSFVERMAEIKQTAGPDLLKMLADVESGYAKYDGRLRNTLAMVKEHGAETRDDEARKTIRDAVTASRAVADRLEEAVRTVADTADANATKISDQASARAAAIQTMMIVIAIAGTVGGVGLGFVVGNFGISRPIAAAVDSLKKLSDGRTDIEIYGVGRKDEIGLIADTMQVFKENIIRNRRMEEEAKAAEIRAAKDRKAALNKMADDFQGQVGGIVQSVSSAATEMQSSSQTLSATAEETSRQATTVAAAAEQASTNVQTVASATEELSISISEITRQVSKSTEIAGRAVAEAGRTHTQVRGLAEAAQKIGDVVSLITDIAEQTNLLALNATIEAARAGEAGKGFAVVASEVKNLANQTARATDEISAQISGIQQETLQAVAAIDGIAKTIAEVNQIATAIASAVEEQGAATKEIARNVEQAAAGTNEVTSNITGVSQAASETGNAAIQMLDAANELAGNSETLKREVDKFLATVRQS